MYPALLPYDRRTINQVFGRFACIDKSQHKWLLKSEYRHELVCQLTLSRAARTWLMQVGDFDSLEEMARFIRRFVY